MQAKLKFVILLFFLAVIGLVPSLSMKQKSQINLPSPHSTSSGACTSFCVQNGDHCIFGTNFDNLLEMGKLFVNKRQVLKTNWDPNPSGEYARWVSRFGSVTVNFVGFQMVWAGMNEAGLMISTMSLNDTQGPSPDERFLFESPFWMQYQLDNHSTVEQVIASNQEIRVPQSQIDHYLVCDRTSECAVIEFLDGKLVSYTGESLPIKALTNSTYEISLTAMKEIQQGGGQEYGNSIHRFVASAERLSAYPPSDSQAAVRYAFDTLEAVSRNDTIWSFVHDPINLRVYFRTFGNPEIRSLDFSSLDFSCQTEVQMLDVHQNLSGDIKDDLVAYDHQANFNHTTRFFSAYEGASMSPILVEILLRGVESFPCQKEGRIPVGDLERYDPLLPPTIIWAGLTVFHFLWPVWILLVAFSLAFCYWRMAADRQQPVGKYLLWTLVIVILGPIGLLAFLIVRSMKKRRLHVN